MSGATDKLLRRHPRLVHSEMMAVTSHVQRQDGDWFINTLMLQSIEVPFKYKRRKRYKSLQGARVNLTYYPDTERVAGIEMEVMKVIRVRRS